LLLVYSRPNGFVLAPGPRADLCGGLGARRFFAMASCRIIRTVGVGRCVAFGLGPLCCLTTFAPREFAFRFRGTGG